MTLCFLFERKWLQENIETLMMFNTRRRWSLSPRLKLPLVKMLDSWFCGVNFFDLNLGVKLDSVEQLVKRNSVGSGHVSHRWTSALNDHFDHCFVVFAFVWVWICDFASSFLPPDGLVIRYSSMNVALPSRPTSQEQVARPSLN